MSRKPKHSDVEYIKAMQDGNNALMAEFYEHCREYFTESIKSTVEYTGYRAVQVIDIFQDSFMKLWDEIQCRKIYVRDNKAWRVDREGKQRQMSASLTTFLMAIAKCKNYENARAEARYLDDASCMGEPVDNEPDEHIAEYLVQRCVNELPQRCKEILTLFYYEMKSLDEILTIRKENNTKDGLKTGKSKCMSKLKERIVETFKDNNLKLSAYV